ncbi:uncharacterized protein RCC_05191 [Ramularia collo-cygni]|uniref:Uncharacterized protein n=1 Tax=Ramularia collo-cygni TaxID=112498 RepID=A0A2D3VFA5_9PEZI|nr:uncharacterized protein RCC_05191 [Ramularia collo-cygni]CZT19343.1 uncharacterized protein RCC_05191 [Ramularia collo-cygni]
MAHSHCKDTDTSTMLSQRASASKRVRRQRSQHNSSVPFVRLPAELKNQIWGLVIPSETTFDASKQAQTLEDYTSKCRAAQDEERRKQSMLLSDGGIHFICTSSPLRSLLGEDRQTRWRKPGGNKPGGKTFKADVRAFYQIEPKPYTPAITQVCKAFRPETLRFFYGSNTFELRTSDQMTYEAMVSWLSCRPQVGIEAMRRVIVSYILKEEESDNLREDFSLPYPSVRIRLLMDFEMGVAKAVALPDVKSSISSRHLYLLQPPWHISPPWTYHIKDKTDWPTDSAVTMGDNKSGEITVPATALDKAIEDIRLVHGFGGEKVLTLERLMHVVKAFNFYKKGFYKDSPAHLPDTSRAL